MVSSLPPVGHLGSCEISEVPTIEELGYENVNKVGRYHFILKSSWTPNKRGWCLQDEFSPFKGGESEALKRLAECMRKKVISNIENESLQADVNSSLLMTGYMKLLVKVSIVTTSHRLFSG